MLQYVAVCCSMLQYVAVVMSIDFDVQGAHATRYLYEFVCVAVCCSMLQYVCVCGGGGCIITLQYVAVCCSSDVCRL